MYFCVCFAAYNLPIYPQLQTDSVNFQHFLVIWLVKSNSGELIGGLDIIKEMVESGELQTMLPKKVPSMHYLPPYQAVLVITNVMCSLHSLRFPLTLV